MQRAAASSPASSTLSEPLTPPSKRRRLSKNDHSPTQRSNHTEAVQAALDAEDDKISAAIDRMAADAGDTKWILSYRDGDDADQRGTNPERVLRVLTMGYSDIDRANETTERQGRRSFGKFNKELEVNAAQVLNRRRHDTG